MDHQSVLLEAAVTSINPTPGGVYVDCTLGAGGHTELLLERTAPDGKVIGIDQDETALELVSKKLTKEVTSGRLTLIHSSFDKLLGILAGLGYAQVDGIIFDLGFSSMQVDTPERGFSYRVDAPLDMRMDSRQEVTAADLVNTASEEELIRIIKEYGEERWAQRIARAIVQERERKRILTTQELVDVILRAYPKRSKDGTHPARRTFQALRIAVNRELEKLEKVLDQAVIVLRPGGRLGIISFHSLEDRTVKQFFKTEAAECICPPGLPICTCDHQQRLQIVTKKPITPSLEEVKLNPRARSAKLRVAEKVGLTPGNDD